MTITRYRKTRFGRYGMQTERWSPSVSTRRARRKSCAVCKTSNTKGWELNLGSVPSPGERRSAGRIRLARARRSDLGGSLTMSSTQERIKKRQEYLKKKAGAYANMSIYSLITLPLSLVAGFSLIAVMLYLYDYISGKPSPDYGMSGLAVSQSRQEGDCHEDTAQPLLRRLQGQAGPGSHQRASNPQPDRQRCPGASQPADAVETPTAGEPAQRLRRQAGQGEQRAGGAHRSTLPADRPAQGRTRLSQKKVRTSRLRTYGCGWSETILGSQLRASVNCWVCRARGSTIRPAVRVNSMCF